jgi:hypothetical protein
MLVLVLVLVLMLMLMLMLVLMVARLFAAVTLRIHSKQCTARLSPLSL